MMKIRDLRESGHAPSLLAAFLHFDVSFMVWVILGALMPFISSDPGLTGVNLEIVPTAAVSKNGQYTLLVKEASTAKGQARTVYNLLIKAGDPAAATRPSVKPVEKFVLDNARPETLAALNATSKLIRVQLAPEARGNPHEAVISLQPRAAIAAAGKSSILVANGYPASTKLALVGLPLLAAAFWRILLGLLADRFGSRRVGIASLMVTLFPLLAGWRLAHSMPELQLVGFFLGAAGASFAIALPLASRWYPPRLQGIAMGIAGAGNSGTVLATVFAPLLARAYGWNMVFLLLAVPVSLVLLVFTFLARDPPGQTAPKAFSEYLSVLTVPDCWWLCLFYFVSFGGFVGMSSFFNSFFVDQYDAAKATVGLMTAPFIIAGSLLRPVGGSLADRVGGIRMLTVLYGAVIACAVGVSLTMTHFAAACLLLLIMMGALGMGNGAVFQLVPQRFKKEIGVITGVVGAAGGVGGYYLNFALGHLKDSTGAYASGFLAFAAIAAVALGALRLVAPAWTRSWLGAGGKALHSDPTLVLPGSAELPATESLSPHRLDPVN